MRAYMAGLCLLGCGAGTSSVTSGSANNSPFGQPSSPCELDPVCARKAKEQTPSDDAKNLSARSDGCVNGAVRSRGIMGAAIQGVAIAVDILDHGIVSKTLTGATDQEGKFRICLTKRDLGENRFASVRIRVEKSGFIAPPVERAVELSRVPMRADFVLDPVP